ncbi:MAG TPA: hypothetical protein VF598_09195, partial [Hymenobacter sp.]
MRQYSINGESVELEVLSGHLLFIDPLYLIDIRDSESKVSFVDQSLEFVMMLEKNFFPYGGDDLLEYKKLDDKIKFFSLDISNVKYFDHNADDQRQTEKACRKDVIAFGVDSGSILIIDLINFNAMMNIDEVLLDKLKDMV